MWTVIHGNIVDGVQHIGPFETHDEALAYAEDLDVGDWLIAELHDPAEDEEVTD